MFRSVAHHNAIFMLFMENKTRNIISFNIFRRFISTKQLRYFLFPTFFQEQRMKLNKVKNFSKGRRFLLSKLSFSVCLSASLLLFVCVCRVIGFPSHEKENFEIIEKFRFYLLFDFGTRIRCCVIYRTGIKGIHIQCTSTRHNIKATLYILYTYTQHEKCNYNIFAKHRRDFFDRNIHLLQRRES